MDQLRAAALGGVISFLLLTSILEPAVIGPWLKDWQTLVTGLIALGVGWVAYRGIKRQTGLSQELFRAAAGELDPDIFIEPRTGSNISALPTVFYLRVANRNRHPMALTRIEVVNPELMMPSLSKENGELWGVENHPQEDEAKRVWSLQYRIAGTPAGNTPTVVGFFLQLMDPGGQPPAPGREIKIAVEYDLFGTRTERRRAVVTAFGHAATQSL